MKSALIFVAVAFVVLAQMTVSYAKPEPQPFNLGKFVNKMSGTVVNVVSDKGNCMLKKGIPQSILKKAVGCSPSALMGPEAFAACAGIANINEAKNAVKCFTG